MDQLLEYIHLSPTEIASGIHQHYYRAYHPELLFNKTSSQFVDSLNNRPGNDVTPLGGGGNWRKAHPDKIFWKIHQYVHVKVAFVKKRVE